MANYRIYIMDWAGRHIEDFVPVSALCDADAIDISRRRRDRQPTELWLGGKQLCALAPYREPMPVRKGLGLNVGMQRYGVCA